MIPLLLVLSASGNDLAHGPLLLPELPTSQSLPLQAFALPEDPAAACEASDYAALEARGDGVYLGGASILALEDGTLPDDARGEARVTLTHQLGQLWARGEAAHQAGCTPWVLEEEASAPLERLLLVVDRQVPTATIAELARAADIAGFRQLAFAVRAEPTEGRWSPPEPPPEDDINAPFPITMGLGLETEGVRVSAHAKRLEEAGLLTEPEGPPSLPCADAPCLGMDDWDWNALDDWAGKVGAIEPTIDTLILGTDPGASFDTLLRAAAAVRWSSQGSPSFRLVTFATGPGDGEEPEGVGKRKKRHAGALSAEGQVSVVVLSGPSALGGLGSKGRAGTPRGIVGGGLGSRGSGGPASYGGFGGAQLPITMSWDNVAAEGSMDSAVVREHLQPFDRQIQYCYQRMLNRDPKLAGTVKVSFTVDGDGAVQDVRVLDNSVGNEQVGTCVGLRMQRMNFADLDESGPTTVEITLSFESGE